MSRAAAVLDIAADHPAYAGHFPGMPVLPGVVLLDHALHAIGAGLGVALDSCQLGTVKFLQPVKPGQALRVEYDDAGMIRFDIFAGEQRVATGSIRKREV